MDTDVTDKIRSQRESLVRRLELRLDKPMALLGVIWLVLIAVEFTRGLGPFLAQIVFAIWIVFIVDFVFKFLIAPNKLRYLRRHWLTAISLAVPALRGVRALYFLRAARAVRGVRLLRLLASWNRGIRALGSTMRQRGFGYVTLLTIFVLFSGAAGIYAFERDAVPEGGLSSYGTALWWTAMILTTMGSEYWPKTPEGRFVCLLLAVYGFTIFGYVTATLASFFLAQDGAKAKGAGAAIRQPCP